MFLRPYLCLAWKRPTVGRSLTIQPHGHYPHVLPSFSFGRPKDCFSSGAWLKQKQPEKDNTASEEWAEPQNQRKRGSRNPAAPTSLRRVAVEAQRSKDSFLSKAQLREQGFYQTKVLTIKTTSETASLLILLFLE